MSAQPSPLELLALAPSFAQMWFLFKRKQYKELCRTFSRVMKSPKQKQRAFAGYTPTKHDVFVCTYAKSGTYWTMQIAHQIANYGKAEFEHVHDVIPWPDVFMPTAVTLEDTRPQESSPTGLRVIKTHLESQYIPYNTEAKYIVVVRDPKEAFVSSYHFAHALSPFGKMSFTVDEWMELFLANQTPYDSWAEHTASFWEWRKRSNVLFLTFEEMKKNHRAVTEHIAEFMGVKLTESELENVLTRSSFDYMKKIDEKFTPNIPMIVKNQAESVMVRKGQSGKSDELINKEQQITIDHFCQSELKRFNSDFPYTEMFKLAEAASQKTLQPA